VPQIATNPDRTLLKARWTDENPPPHLCDAIPPRPADAPTGSQFARSVWNLTGSAREQTILSELRHGNIPSFLRQLKPVELSYQPKRGERVTAVIWVMPDYLAIGLDEDYLRIPVGLPTALAVADAFNFSLPTGKMVDAIYQQSNFRLTPRPMKPGRAMTSTAYYVQHQQTIEGQRRGHGLGELLSGHKKDVILTKRLWRRQGRVAIYGWHERSGQPIQPLSTVHGARYADYSHGVRLVSTRVLVNGELRSIFEVLEDPKLAPVLAYEGVIRDAERLMTPSAPSTSRSPASE
jgi:hypothetical protein